MLLISTPHRRGERLTESLGTRLVFRGGVGVLVPAALWTKVRQLKLPGVMSSAGLLGKST